MQRTEGPESGIKPWNYKGKTGFTESFDLPLGFWTQYTDPGKQVNMQTELFCRQLLLLLCPYRLEVPTGIQMHVSYDLVRYKTSENKKLNLCN